MRKSDLHITFKNIFNIALITLIFVGCTNVPEKYINLENESTKLSHMGLHIHAIRTESQNFR